MFEDLSYINCRDLLESTDIKNISESGGEITFSCPSAEHFHGDNSPSARMNSRTSLWICHGCGRRGTGITFLAWHRSLPETTARRLLEERYGGGITNTGVWNLEDMVKKIMSPEIVEEEKRTHPDETWNNEFRVNWFHNYAEVPCYRYMISRGFRPDILAKWEIGYDKISDRVVIPIRDDKGNLVGFKGRSWRKNIEPRYMILGDTDLSGHKRYGFQPYQKSKYVFGLHNHIEENWESFGKGVIIVEGELNVIAMDQYGYNNCLGIAGSEISHLQISLICQYTSKAIIYLDNDKAGNKGTKKVLEMLPPCIPLRVIQNAPGDAAELDKDTVDSLIHGAKSTLELQVEGKI